MANPFIHVELNTPDPEAMKAFYSRLFQWDFEEISYPGARQDSYTVMKPGDGIDAGIVKQLPGAPAGWIAYVAVDDIYASTDKARSLGAEVLREAVEVPDQGLFSLIRDPGGTSLWLWQVQSRAKAVEVQSQDSSKAAA